MPSDYVKELISIADSMTFEDIFTIPDGMSRSIWEDKYARKVGDRFETWEERIKQVVIGNYSLKDQSLFDREEFEETLRLSVAGVMCYAGRHLQHGDYEQKNKIMDLFSNCSSSPFSFLTLWKSLCGKGVSSDYSSHVRPVNWDNMPNFRLVLNGGEDDSGEISKGAHSDFKYVMSEFQGCFESLRDAQKKYPSNSEWVRWFKVEDSREGWAQVLCALETAAYHEKHKHKLFIFDFSDVRCAGTPIMGHQGRPASGPIPLMRCLAKVGTIKGSYMAPWKQAMYIDDYMAQCVSIGGVRRNARMAVMWWEDSAIFEFIEIKRGGHLRMANNTILVDKKFHEQKKDPRTHAYRVFQAACAAAYYDNTGEPGFSNVHNMRQNRQNLDFISAKSLLSLEASGLKIHEKTYDFMEKVIKTIKSAPYICIPNPCGEADLSNFGDDCLVGDIGLHKAKSLKEACVAAELMARSLVRVSSLMPAICQAERHRTNKVGVSAVGILEFFFNHYQLGFYDLLLAYDWFFNKKSLQPDDGPEYKAVCAWMDFNAIARAARYGAEDEARILGVEKPDVETLLKPGGTVAKVVAATESANLPSRRYYLRYIQFPKTVIAEMPDGDRFHAPNPKVGRYQGLGYPVRDISHKYPGYVVVGFPTVQPYIKMLDESNASHKIATANNVSIEDHYKWLRLLEFNWLGCRDNGEPQGGQIAYTLKYNPRKTSFDEFMKVIGEHQPYIRNCTFATCSSDDEVLEETKELIENYGWCPEVPISREEYEAMVSKIKSVQKEEYNEADLMCESGFCSIEDNIN